MALMRSLLSKLSLIQISPKHLRANGIVNCIFSPRYVLQVETTEKCGIRTLRSAASNNFEGVKLNASQQTSAQPQQEILVDQHDLEIAVTKETIAKVNHQIKKNSHGRLFAIIHFAGKQRRVTDGDLIMVEGTHPTNVGDIIRAEKVLLLGSRDFTLLGRPLLRPDLESQKKELHENQLNHFSILRINCVRLEGLVDQRPEIEGVEGRVF